MVDNGEQALWYVMRDLKRANARDRAYSLFEDEQFEVFTPMQWTLVTRQGRRVREERPVIPDLLFVRATRRSLNPVVERIPTLQYRYVRGGKYRDPMIVAEADMERFIRAVRSSDSPSLLSSGRNYSHHVRPSYPHCRWSVGRFRGQPCHYARFSPQTVAGGIALSFVGGSGSQSGVYTTCKVKTMNVS